MKKIITCILALAVCCSMTVACSENPDVPSVENTPEVTTREETTKPETTEATYSEEYLKEHPKKVTVTLDTNGCDFDKEFNVEFWENYGEKLKITLTKDNGYTAILPVKMDMEYLLVWNFDGIEDYKVDYSKAEIKAADMFASFKITELPPAPTAEELEKQGAEVMKKFLEAVEPLQENKNILDFCSIGVGADDIGVNYVDEEKGRTTEQWQEMSVFERYNFEKTTFLPEHFLGRKNTSKDKYMESLTNMIGEFSIKNVDGLENYYNAILEVWEYHWYVWENRSRTGIPFVDVWSAYEKYYGETKTAEE